MRAVIDACVLYPTVLREIVLGVARRGLIAPLWSERLLEEWARTAARRGGPADAVLAQGDIAALGACFPDARVRHDPGIEAALWLPDAGDIHVLATAIAGKAEIILTLNLRDFPRAEMAAHGLSAVHPDAVLSALWRDHPTAVADVVAGVHGKAARMAGTDLPRSGLLKRARLPRLAKALG